MPHHALVTQRHAEVAIPDLLPAQALLAAGQPRALAGEQLHSPAADGETNQFYRANYLELNLLFLIFGIPSPGFDIP